MIRDITVSVGSHRGMAVFSIVSCVNGTGGCDQHFVGRDARRWVPLNERYREQLEQRFMDILPGRESRGRPEAQFQ